MPGPLRDRRYERFCLELAELKPQGDAYAAAGFSPDPSNAAKLVKRPEIIARIRELQDELVEFSNIRRERIVCEIDRVGRARIGDYYERVRVKDEATGKTRTVTRLKDPLKLTAEQQAAVQSIEVDPKTGEQKIKLHDRTAANHTLLRYLGGLPEAPAAPTFNMFNVLPADAQRALAAALDALAGADGALGQPAPGERGSD